MGSSKKFKTAVLGGTFDHFHKGHRKLLEHGLSISKKLVVGVTSDEYVQKLKSQNSKVNPPAGGQNSKSFEKFSVREKSVEEFLKKNTSGKFEIVKIDDMFGTTLSDTPIDAIVVSKETLKGAVVINTKRLEKNLPPFEIIITESVLAQDGKPISSFRIRNGEINREGKLYIKPQWLSGNLLITDKIRRELKEPLGALFRKSDLQLFENLNGFFISAGDEATRILNSLSLNPAISVIDFKVGRKKIFSNLKELGFTGEENIMKISNPAGVIASGLFDVIKKAFENIEERRQIIIVDGEDDLSVLPLALTSPLGSYIFYGQPNAGIVRIRVDEETKENFYKIVANFKTLGH